MLSAVILKKGLLCFPHVPQCPAAGMLGRMRTRCSPTIIYLFADMGAATSAGAIWQWFTCCCQLLPACGGCSGSWGSAWVPWFDIWAFALSFQWEPGSSKPLPVSKPIAMTLLMRFPRGFLACGLKMQLPNFHISTDSHCRGASQPETIVSPRYKSILVWRFLLQ